MRMTYRRSKSRVILAALLAASVTVVTLGYRSGSNGPLHRVQQDAVSIVAPLGRGVTKVLSPVGSFFDSIAHIPTLSSENARLRRQIAALHAQQSQFQALQQQLNDADAQLQEVPWYSGNRLGAQVILGSVSNQEWTITLDKGSANGVQDGMAVVSQDGLIGRITDVAAQYATVLEMIDPTHSVSGRLVTTSDTGLINGNGAANLTMTGLPPTATVTSGEEVVTSGYSGGVYPPGIPIGRVANVHSVDNGLAQEAAVQPFVNFNKLGLVQILLDTHQTVPGP